MGIMSSKHNTDGIDLIIKEIKSRSHIITREDIREIIRELNKIRNKVIKGDILDLTGQRQELVMIMYPGTSPLNKRCCDRLKEVVNMQWARLLSPEEIERERLARSRRLTPKDLIDPEFTTPLFHIYTASRPSRTPYIDDILSEADIPKQLREELSKIRRTIISKGISEDEGLHNLLCAFAPDITTMLTLTYEDLPDDKKQKLDEFKQKLKELRKEAFKERLDETSVINRFLSTELTPHISKILAHHNPSKALRTKLLHAKLSAFLRNTPENDLLNQKTEGQDSLMEQIHNELIMFHIDEMITWKELTEESRTALQTWREQILNGEISKAKAIENFIRVETPRINAFLTHQELSETLRKNLALAKLEAHITCTSENDLLEKSEAGRGSLIEQVHADLIPCITALLASKQLGDLYTNRLIAAQEEVLSTTITEEEILKKCLPPTDATDATEGIDGLLAYPGLSKEIRIKILTAKWLVLMSQPPIDEEKALDTALTAAERKEVHNILLNSTRALLTMHEKQQVKEHLSSEDKELLEKIVKNMAELNMSDSSTRAAASYSFFTPPSSRSSEPKPSSSSQRSSLQP